MTDWSHLTLPQLDELKRMGVSPEKVDAEIERRGKPEPAKRRGRMNSAETRYAQELEARKAAGDVLWWAFEPLRIRLAKRANWTPDFWVLLADGSIEVVEVKGRMRRDAPVHFNVGAESIPWATFRMIRWTKSRWEVLRERRAEITVEAS